LKKYLAFFGVIRGWDALEDLELSERGGTFGSLVGQHASHSPPEDLGGTSVVLDPSAGVVRGGFVEELVELDLVSEERAGLEKSFGSDNDDSLTVEELLGNL